MIRWILCFFISFSFAACQSNQTSTVTPKKISKTQLSSTTICIQPFDDFPKSELDAITKKLKNNIPNLTVNKPIALPRHALNADKTRYRADSILNFLRKQTAKNVHTIGMTTKDISTTKPNDADWGVMGLGSSPGSVCVVSTFRLKGKNKLEKFYKVSIHELGHNEGLPHCSNPICYMRDAKGKDHFDNETQFCAHCKSVLIKAGWKNL